MTSQTLLKSLEKMEFTRDMEPKHLAKLAAMASAVTFSEGQTIYNEGELDNRLYLIESGLVSVETEMPGRGRVSLFTVGPGQLLGWSSMFMYKRKTASSRAIKPTRAIVLNARELREACDADHDLGYGVAWRIAEIIADRLKGTRLQLMDIFAPVGVD